MKMYVLSPCLVILASILIGGESKEVGSKKYECDMECGNDDAQVCGVDNKTYLKRDICKTVCEKKKPVELLHYGECGNCDKTNVCPWRKECKKRKTGKYRFEFIFYKIRRMIEEKFTGEATNGVYYNICEFQIARCKMFKSDGKILRMVKKLPIEERRLEDDKNRKTRRR